MKNGNLSTNLIIVTIEVLLLVLIFAPLIVSQDCGVNPPLSADECVNNYVDSDHHCCYLVNVNTTMCRLIPSYNYEKDMVRYIVNGEEYNITCLQSSPNKTIGTYCGDKAGKGVDGGINNITSYLDCTPFSESNNDCCFFTNNYTHFSRCFWLGQRFSTEIAFFDTGPNTTLICGNFRIRLNFRYIVILLFFVLF